MSFSSLEKVVFLSVSTFDIHFNNILFKIDIILVTSYYILPYLYLT